MDQQKSVQWYSYQDDYSGAEDKVDKMLIQEQNFKVLKRQVWKGDK